MNIQDQPTTTTAPPMADDPYWLSLFALEESDPPSKKEMSQPPEELKSLPPSASNHVPKPKMSAQWLRAEQAYKQDELLELTVIDYNKGGLLVDWNGLQGFVPASQLVILPHFHIEAERLRELKRRINSKLRLKIIEFDRATNRLILSERAAEVGASDREKLLSSLKAGEIVKGRVTNLTKFGAFVDLGGVEGLIHISELSWGRVEHPSHILTEGEPVETLVLGVQPAEERIALSLKQLQINPWEKLEERYTPGQYVTGTVSNILHFGAFVQVEDGLEGLIHTSELAEGAFMHPKNVVQLGQKVRARVLEANGAKRRLALSLRKEPVEDESQETDS